MDVTLHDPLPLNIYCSKGSKNFYTNYSKHVNFLMAISYGSGTWVDYTNILNYTIL